jgi:acyl carrier protein
MGLDGVELLMEIEDAFKISISDEEVSEAITVGKLYQCVLDKIKVSTEERCSSQKSFYLLRAALRENLGIEAKSVTPRTTTEKLFPKPDRRKLWSKISINVPYKFPELIYPYWIDVLFAIGGMISGYFCSYFVYQYFKQNNNMFMCFISCFLFIPVFILVYLFMKKIFLPIKLTIPDTCETLGGMVKHILYHNVDYFGTMNEQEVWSKLTFIISEQMGIDQEDIKPESNFVKDLGL